MSSSIFTREEYKGWLKTLKQKIQSSQIKAAVKVNQELLQLYWQLGEGIYEKEQKANWGDALIDQLSIDLTAAFPGMKGFSRANLFFIRKWFLFYHNPKIVSQVVRQLPKNDKETFDLQKVSQVVRQIPWGHNREIISKCRNVEEALFYVRQTLQNNWSRAVLVTQLQRGLYKRKGKTLDNFSTTLPLPQADLARETFKNPYCFDFLTISEEVRERDVEQALIDHIQKFLLELGQGFAYMGKQYPLRIGTSDFFLDLLFYHTRLRCYVVVELKVIEFQPEFAGKLNFYLNVIDDQMRHETDGPSIGILLCKTPDKVVVEYALRNLSSPMGVAEYQLTETIPEDLKGKLPSVDVLENELRVTGLK